MRLFRRISWSVLDQGTASVSNLLLSITVARFATVAEFGVFGLLYALYQIMLGTSRAAVGDASLIRTDKQGVLGAGLLLGLIASVVALTVAAVGGESVSRLFLIMALAAPALMAFDAMRYRFFCDQRPREAFLMDFGWLIFQVIGFGLLITSDTATPANLVAVWAGSAVIPLLFAVIAQRCWTDVRQGVRWFRSNRDLSLPFLGEYAAISGVQQAVTVTALSVGGLSAVAAVRGGQVLMGPASILAMSVSLVALPAMARSVQTATRAATTRVATLVGLSGAFVIGAWGLVGLMIPDHVGRELLGQSWEDGRAVLIYFVLLLSINGLCYGATAGLRAMQLSSLSLRLRLVTAPVAVASIVLGSVLGQVSGMLLGAVVGASLQTIVWWVAYLRVQARRGRLA